MADYSVQPDRFIGWTITDNRTGEMVGAGWTQRAALFRAHRMAWIDNVRKMAAPIPGARVRVRRPRVYRAFATHAVNSAWERLEAVSSDWCEQAQRYHEAMVHDQRLVKMEKTAHGITYTLRLEPGQGIRSVWVGSGVAGAIDGDGKVTVGFDPAFGLQLRGCDPATAAEVSNHMSGSKVDARWGKLFAGPDLRKSSKSGQIQGVRADLIDMDEADYTGRLAEIAEKHYGTRDFKF